MRLIDADALPKYTGYALSADEVAMAVENAPTIDAVPATIEGALGYLHKVGWMQEHDRIMTEDAAPVRHGRWEAVNTDVQAWTVQCSACKMIGFTGKYPYCPNCGARMDGDDNEIDRRGCASKADTNIRG